MDESISEEKLSVAPYFDLPPAGNVTDLLNLLLDPSVAGLDDMALENVPCPKESFDLLAPGSDIPAEANEAEDSEGDTPVHGRRKRDRRVYFEGVAYDEDRTVKKASILLGDDTNLFAEETAQQTAHEKHRSL